MFRLKITLTHAILVCVLIGAAHWLVSSHLSGEVEQRAESSLRRAAVIAEQTKRFDHFALMEKGRKVAEDADIYSFLTLEREKLITKIQDEASVILTSDVGKKLGKDSDKKKAVDAEGEVQLSTTDLRHLAVDFRLRVARKRFNLIEDDLSKTARNLDLGLVERRPVQPDMLMALNKNGVAVAARGQDLYHWGSSSYSPDVTKEHPIVQKVLDSPKDGPKLDVWEWSWGKGDDPSLYQVAVVPIRPSNEHEAAGVAVVGYTIHDGAAEDIQRIVGGVTTRKGKQNQYVDKDQVETAPDVAFFRGGSVHSSTLDSSRNEQLEEKLFGKQNLHEKADRDPEKMVSFSMDETSYAGFVRFLPDVAGSDKRTGVVVLSNMQEVREPLATMLSQFDMIAFAVVLIGIALLLFFYYRFIKPAGEIEETISEILSGNKDAEFVVSRNDTVFSSLAQGLNLMSAYLQGKPMPDEEAELEGWGEMIGDGPDAESGDGGGGGGSPEVQGVEMPGMGPGGGDDGDDDGSSDDGRS